jgi:hypothetical protein
MTRRAVNTGILASAVVYEPKQHKLLPHLGADIRAQTGQQDFVGSAPLNLIYVAVYFSRKARRNDFANGSVRYCAKVRVPVMM